MRSECEECGEWKNCNEDGVCFDCVQDHADLEDWLPEDGYNGEEDEDSDSE